MTGETGSDNRKVKVKVEGQAFEVCCSACNRTMAVPDPLKEKKKKKKEADGKIQGQCL